MIPTHVLHPWHGVPSGEQSPRVVNAIIEIPQGSRCKYEIDKKSGLLKLDRVIFSSFYYPINYGFIPQSYGGDKDPLDILVITSLPVQPLTLMEAKVIGVMQMIDGGENDDKIINSYLLVTDKKENMIEGYSIGGFTKKIIPSNRLTK